MRIRLLAGTILLSILLQGCARTAPLIETPTNAATAAPLSLTSTATPIPTAANTPTVAATRTAVPSPAPTATPQVIVETSQIIEQSCFRQFAELPRRETYPGKLLLSNQDNLNDSQRYSGTNSFFDFNHRQLIMAPPGGIGEMSVSPDGTKYAAWDSADQRIKVFSSQGQLLKILPKGKLQYLIDRWLDNEHLALVVWEQETPIYPRYPMEVVIVNPFTGEQKSFSSLYPDMEAASIILWEGTSTKKFNPQMTRVVYPGYIKNDYLGKEGAGYILWDLEKQEKLAQFVTGNALATPKWAPDGSRFVVNDSWGNGEFYFVTRDGAITRLAIRNPAGQPEGLYTSDVYSWSPDGKYLAFWWEYEMGGGTNARATLAVLNLDTKEVTNTCISVGYTEGGNYKLSSNYLPVWSPDGKSIAVIANEKPSGDFDTLLIDLKKGFATKIADNRIPAGWLVDTQ